MTTPPAGVNNLPRAATGTNREAFGTTEWGLLAAVALIWGSSFLFIDVGLEAFAPGVITLTRVALGTVTIAVFSRSRKPVDREHLPRILLLGVIWIAIPLTIFPIAQQWIDSSVAGMLNAAVPIASAVWATVLLRSFPGWRQAVGIIIGFLGVVAISLPELADSSASALGVGLVLLAVMFYGLSTNLAVPLQQRYGALPVLFRAQLAALVVVVPYGLFQLRDSTWAWDSALAMIPLGVLGTGAAFAMMAILVGRVGAARGSIAIYFVPIVAVALGLIVLNETVEPIAIAGGAVVLTGAWFASRREA
jgi:drug/metabolite transporter (DMT)-like permease